MTARLPASSLGPRASLALGALAAIPATAVTLALAFGAASADEPSGPPPGAPAAHAAPAAPAAPAAAEAPLPDPVTFAEHIAPIVYTHCSSCHRPGEAAPFPLLGYRDVQKRGPMIRLVTGRRFMPPWQPARGYAHLADERGLSAREIALIDRWVETGMAKGPEDAMPAPPAFPVGWELGEPDLVVEMPEAYRVPADGPDIYRNFVFPLGLDEDRWVTAVEIRPSARTVVHHALFFLDGTGRARELDARDPEPGFRGMGFQQAGSLGGWAVGAVARHLPFELARPLPKGADLVVQTHFHPSGRVEEERLKIGLHFAERPPARSLVEFQVPPLYGRFAKIDIPAGERGYTVRGRYEVPVDLELIGAWGHAHKICSSMRARALFPDGRVEPLLYLPRWDFQWQGAYHYAAPVALPKGAVIEVEITYDNSAENPANPHDPPERIRWGLESNDEMGSVIFGAVPANEADKPVLEQNVQARLLLAQLGADGSDRILRRLRRADRDGDGVLSLLEAPEPLRPFFPVLDANGDGVLGEADLAALKARPEDAPRPLGPIALDLDGRAHEPLEVRRGESATLLCFLAPECPIANAYAPELAALARLCEERRVRLILVQVDPDLTEEAARAHAKSYGLGAPIVLDRGRALADRLSVRATPEVVLLAPGGRVYYQGAIDDRFADLGEQRAAPRERYLRAALDDLAAGRPAAATPRTEPIGCLLPAREASAERAADGGAPPAPGTPATPSAPGAPSAPSAPSAPRGSF